MSLSVILGVILCFLTLIRQYLDIFHGLSTQNVYNNFFCALLQRPVTIFSSKKPQVIMGGLCCQRIESPVKLLNDSNL